LPSLRLEQPHSIRRLRVSDFFADSIQQIHSLRASGVMLSHAVNALESVASARLRSAGISCTTPAEIRLRATVRLNHQWQQRVEPKMDSSVDTGRRSAIGTISSTVLRCALLSVMCTFTCSATAQPRTPSDDELHSMYCAEVLRTEIRLQNHMISASSEAAGVGQPELREQWTATSAELLQGLAKLESALNRLQRYMLPRIRTIDSHPLASAIRQANADVQESRSNEAPLNRMRACERPTWVPL
jgi:hypothetical protein